MSAPLLMTFPNCCREPFASTEVVGPKPLPFRIALAQPASGEMLVGPVATIGPRDPNLLDHQAKMATREQGGHPLVSCCETFSRLWLPAALPQI